MSMYAAPKTASGPVLGPAAVVARALVAGSACGLASGALAGIPYLLAYAHRFAVDWSSLAVAFTLFSIATASDDQSTANRCAYARR